MVNHIPNCGLFTNKLNLLCSLQAYEKLQMQSANKAPHFIPLEDYLPLTYKLDDRIDKETFFNTAKSNKIFLQCCVRFCLVTMTLMDLKDSF